MFLDTSAIVALLTNEPRAADIAAAIAKSKRRLTSPLVRLEACIALGKKLDISPTAAEARFDDFLATAEVAVVPITDDMGRKAVLAREVYGKAPARLNLADCLAYAAAKEHRVPILFIGDDFTHTDIKSGLADPSP